MNADGPDGVAGTEDDDLRLQPGSPCIDTGNRGAVTKSTDLDGNPRIVACIVDMGAYEDQRVAAEDRVENVTQGLFYCTIQEAIDAAVSGDEVEVSPGTYNEIIDFGGKAITVRGLNGPATTTIDATGMPALNDGLPVVRCDSGEGPDTVLEGFTLTGGKGHFRFGIPFASTGGGMYIKDSSPTVVNCLFTRNSASAGGGMDNRYGNPTLTDCTFSENMAATGGGMINFGDPTVTNCTFSNNMAQRGGGMANVRDSRAILTNCTFSGNRANRTGGGMFNHRSSPRVINCLFRGNSATYGGGMSISNCGPTITNCTITKNESGGDGGGVYIANDANPVMTNCILWNNSDLGGMDETGQIHTDSGMPVLNYSNIQGGWTGAGGLGNINSDPLFVAGPNGDFLLSQVDAGQLADSPCVDAGIGPAFELYINGSTRTDGGSDAGVVDMGFHVDADLTEFTDGDDDGVINGWDICVEYPNPTQQFPRADIDMDCDVDTNDFAFFAACFNKSNNPPRGGCSPAQIEAFDFDDDHDVDTIDFTTFASCYNKANNPPRPLGCPQN